MHHTCTSCSATQVKLQCNTWMCVHSCAPELGDTQNSASFGNIFFLFALNQLHTEEILMSFIYTHVGVKPPRSCWDVKSWSALGALSEIADFHRIRCFFFSLLVFFYILHMKGVWRTSRRWVRVTFPGWKASTGLIGLCVWLLFLLISCAIRLADEKTERCHQSWQRYHRAGARVCQAISYWWVSEAAVMFVMTPIDILCGVQIVYWLIIDDMMHTQDENNTFMFADNVLITAQHGSTRRLQRINIHQLFWWQIKACRVW